MSLGTARAERNTDNAPSSFQSSGSPFYMDYKEDGAMKQGWNISWLGLSDCCSVELERSFYLVELNPDTQAVSDRPEWCCVRYSSVFHHMTGFELE